MDTASPFNLDHEIRRWRDAMLSAPAFRPSDADELESHLRDSIASLEKTGLTPREAFWVASSRVGDLEALRVEFGKVNAEQVWLDRLLWMVAGSMAIGFGLRMVELAVTCLGLAFFELTQSTRLLGPVSLGLQLAAVAALGIAVWRSRRREDGWMWRAGNWLKDRPRTAGGIALLLTLLSSASSVGTNALSVKIMPMQAYASFIMWRFPAGVLVTLLWPIALVWLLSRVRVKRTAGVSPA
jgi:hypothetical protein